MEIRVTIGEKIYSFSKGITLLEVVEKLKDTFRYPVLACFVDHDLCELTYTLEKDCKLRFIDITSRVGNRIYQKSLLFLLLVAVKKLYTKNEMIRVCHSIDKALRIRTNFDLTLESLKNIQDMMQQMVDHPLLFKKFLVNKKEALRYFSDVSFDSNVQALKYITNHYINLYQLGDVFNYFYSILPYDTSVLGKFNLLLVSKNEFILQFPTTESANEIPIYVERPKILEAFNDNYKLSKKFGIYYASDLNRMIANGKVYDIIQLDEVVANQQLLQLANEIYQRKDQIKIVLIAGPSSSGKTTTARKLSLFLRSFGMNPKPLSIDDYFVARENTPIMEDGSYDFESLHAIDLDLFNDHLSRLLQHEEVSIPTFNFVKGIPEFLGNTIQLKDNDILIIEGLHGLNEELTAKIPKENKYKVYVSPLTDLNIDDFNTVSTSDVRLLRRIVRDHRTRGYNALDTISSWDRVRKGEEKNIFPYQGDADFVFNSALIYEIGVLKLYAEPLLYEIDNESPYYEEVRRLINFLDMFLAIPPDSIPADSILREFIGNSYFE